MYRTCRILTGIALFGLFIPILPARQQAQRPAQQTAGQSAIRLWPGGAPEAPATPQDAPPATMRVTPQGEHVVTNVREPTITPFLPPAVTATGATVIIAPGGGHSEIWIDHEGYAVAEFLRAHGVAAFVLQYRLARAASSTYTVEGTELGDMQRALRTVRSRSREWALDPSRVGVMGFSAGGELAALAATRSDPGRPDASDPVERFSSAANFQALLYPALPAETRLTAQTPPAFLACGALDRAGISQGLAEFYLALARLHVPAELHIYAATGHGFGMRASNPAPVSAWPELFLQWMERQGLLKVAPGS